MLLLLFLLLLLFFGVFFLFVSGLCILELRFANAFNENRNISIEEGAGGGGISKQKVLPVYLGMCVCRQRIVLFYCILYSILLISPATTTTTVAVAAKFFASNFNLAAEPSLL